MSDNSFFQKKKLFNFNNPYKYKTQLLCDGDSFFELNRANPYVHKGTLQSHKCLRCKNALSHPKNGHSSSKSVKKKKYTVFCCAKRKPIQKMSRKQSKSRFKSSKECPVHKCKTKIWNQNSKYSNNYKENSSPRNSHYNRYASMPIYKDSNGNSKTSDYFKVVEHSRESVQSSFVNSSNVMEFNKLKSDTSPVVLKEKKNPKYTNKTKTSLWKLNSDTESPINPENTSNSNKSEAKSRKSKNDYSKTLGLLLQLLTKNKMNLNKQKLSKTKSIEKIKETDCGEGNITNLEEKSPFESEADIDLNIADEEEEFSLAHQTNEAPVYDSSSNLMKPASQFNADQGDRPKLFANKTLLNKNKFYEDSTKKISNITTQVLISESLIESSLVIEEKFRTDEIKLNNFVNKAVKKISKLVRKDILAKTKLNVEIKKKKSKTIQDKMILKNSLHKISKEDEYFLDMLTKKCVEKMFNLTMKDMIESHDMDNNIDSKHLKRIEQKTDQCVILINAIVVNFVLNRLWKKITKKFTDDIINKRLHRPMKLSEKKYDEKEIENDIGQQLCSSKLSIKSDLETFVIKSNEEKTKGLVYTSQEIKLNYEEEVEKQKYKSDSWIASKPNSNRKNSKSFQMAKAFMKYLTPKYSKTKENNTFISSQKTESLLKDRAIKKSIEDSNINESDTNEDVSTFCDSPCLSKNRRPPKEGRALKTPKSESFHSKRIRSLRKNKIPKSKKNPGLLFFHSANKKKNALKATNMNYKLYRKKVRAAEPIFVYKHANKEKYPPTCEQQACPDQLSENSVDYDSNVEADNNSNSEDLQNQQTIPLYRRLKNYLRHRSCSGSHDIRDAYCCPQHGFKKRILSAGFIYRQSLHQNNIGNMEMSEEDCDEVVEYFDDEINALSVILE